MATEVRTCPNCKYDNPAGVFFCEQCGTLLACASSAYSSSSESRIPEPAESSEVPRPDTETLLERVVTESGLESKKTRGGYQVVVPLDGARQQRVHVLFNGRDDDGHDMISFLSLCGPAEARHAMSFLRFNSKLTYGAFAVRRIDGKEHFVATANQLASTADPEEVRKQLFEVAKRANAVEAKLSKGEDVH